MATPTAPGPAAGPEGNQLHTGCRARDRLTGVEVTVISVEHRIIRVRSDLDVEWAVDRRLMVRVPDAPQTKEAP